MVLNINDTKSQKEKIKMTPMDEQSARTHPRIFQWMNSLQEHIQEIFQLIINVSGLSNSSSS